MRLVLNRVLFSAVGVVLAAAHLVAQSTPPVNASRDSSIFAPLTLPPAPSPIRLATGAPGPKYWQNRADYDLHATLDTVTHTVQGSMTLRYTNHSHDTLAVLWLQTELTKEVIDHCTQLVHGTPVALTPKHPNNDPYELQLTPAAPVLPGQMATFQMTWHFPMDPGEGGRMGRTGSLYQVAQWYPRVNVYDDVKGWNTESYAGNEEFYLEYGDYTLTVTLPATYIVAATGTLDNPQEVLTPTEITRLALAKTADTVVHVITNDELTSGAAHLKREGMVTWKFHAKNVRDAVWAASPAYQWDATHWKGILAHAFYPATAHDSWKEGADMVRMSLKEYSERWFPYPYPQASIAQGPLTGMEYPMISWIPTFPRKPRLYYSITHEVGHNWFPMIVGSNERVYGWMDEGFNTFINSFSESLRYPENGSQDARTGHEVYNGNGPIQGGPYNGTAYLLQVLRRDVIGADVFDRGFRTYTQRWAYKHPTPADFFRTMNDVSGRNLDWFWRGFFLEGARFDQAIDSVRQTTEGTATHVTVTYGNKGRAVLPLLVRFTFNDSTTQDVVYPVDVWKANPNSYTVSYTFKKPVRRIAVDPETHLPDADETNNRWSAP